mmetsp:Transcript_16020/g.23773  ORF Transcript_16020/g.23773 Transcript_16020/m.23773 type:complete len:436 (+) Transcript_16020:16-1323(+)
MINLLTPVLLIFNILNCQALYGTNSDVVQLNGKNFKDEVLKSDGIWIVEFYAPWCGHCKSLAPEYSKAASHLKGVVNVGAVDATVDEKLAQNYNIQGFPSIKIFSNDKKSPIDYQGPRTAEGIVKEGVSSARKLVKDRQSGKSAPKSENKKNRSEKKSKKETKEGTVIDLTGDNFEDLVLNSDEQWIVKFVAPWCGYCKNLAPEFKSAAKELSGSVKSGSVDCTVHTDLAQKYGVKGYPTIMIFPIGKKTMPITYNGPRESAGIVSESLQILEASGIDPKVVQITEEKNIEKYCSGSTKICVIAALPHISEGGKDSRNAYINTIIGAAKKMKSTLFSYLWTEAGAQVNLEEAFGLSFGFPAVIALSKEKGVYAMHVGAFDEDHVASFLRGILTGATKTSSFAKFPSINAISEWDGKDAQVFEEEFSLEDLMAEEL